MKGYLKKIYTDDLTDIEGYRRFIYIGTLIGCLFLALFSMVNYFFFESYLDSTFEAIGAIVLLIIHRIEINNRAGTWLVILGVVTVALIVMIDIFSRAAADGYVIWLSVFPFICFLLFDKKIAFILSIFLSVAFLSTLILFSMMYPEQGFNIYGVVTSTGALMCGTALAWAYVDNRTKMIHLLAKQAKTDTLTSLLNRRGLMSSFNLFIAMYKRSKQDLCILVLDLDKFKLINDTFGHDVGDIVIIECANAIKSELRDIDSVARLGGEEYVAILPNTSLTQAEMLAYRIKNTIENLTINLPENSARENSFPEKIASESSGIKITASIGLTCASENKVSFETLYKLADQALYKAKHNGRNCVMLG